MYKILGIFEKQSAEVPPPPLLVHPEILGGAYFSPFWLKIYKIGEKRLNIFYYNNEPVAKEPVYWNDFTLWDTATR